MARYSNELGAILASACADFGVRLIKSWEATTALDSPSPTKEEIEEFVAEAVKNFFGTEAAGLKTSPAGLKTSSSPAKVPETTKVKAVKKKKTPATTKKPKCQATTAKGTRCTKCAVGDGPFCSVHIIAAKKKKRDEEPEKPEKSKSKSKSKSGGKKKCEEPEPKPDEREEPVFTVPEYEVEPEEEPDDDVEIDPDFVPTTTTLHEDDFDETTDEDM